MLDEARPVRVIGGRYRLLAELDSGGFGRVWRAHDETLGVDVAVKEIWLPPGLSETERSRLLARARREARNAARLRDDPHIVAVHDVAIEDGVPWLVMRLVHGRSLDKRLGERGPLPEAEAIAVAIALLKALQAARDAGIVHRDIKPANVLLADNGQVLLTDFGIAVQQADTALTGTSELIGTLGYIAPERFDNREANPASDLFSLGATLYQAVEGSAPFRGDTAAAVVGAVLRDDPAPPSHGGVLAPVIVRMLDKDPGRRPTPDEALRLIGEASAARQQPPGPPRATLTLPAKTATIVISRESRLQLATREFEILIDSVIVGRVKNGASRKFPVAPGPHAVSVRSRKYPGADVTVDMSAGGRRTLITGPVVIGSTITSVRLELAPGNGAVGPPARKDNRGAAALVALVAVAALILLSLYHSNRSFADAVSTSGNLSGNVIEASVGSCLYYYTASGGAQDWVSVPCFAASASYRVRARASFPPSEESYYSDLCSGRGAPLLFHPAPAGSDDVELCVVQNPAS